MTSKRVLHFIDSAGVYGAERVILNLSLKMQQTPGYTPVVGCIVNHKDDDNALYKAALELGIEAQKIVIGNSRLFKDIPAAAKQFNALHIDLIHSHGYKPSVFGFFIGKLAKIKVMATCHLWFDPKNGPLKMRAMIWLEKKLYPFFPTVVAVSEPIKQTLLANGVKNAQLVCNGVDIPEPTLNNEQKKQLRHNLGITEDSFVVLNSGRLTRQKAQWSLIEAASLLKQQKQQVHFLIVGEGDLRAELSQMIAAENLQENVQLLGFRKDINNLLAISDVFALPSLDEGMPMSLLEAAAAAKPIITTLVGDIGKLVEHDKTGCVVPVEQPELLAQTILRLRDDKALATHIADNARQQLLAKYSSQAMCESYIDIYQQILAH